MSRPGYDPGMALPALDSIHADWSVTISDLTVTFGCRLIGAEELDRLYDDAARILHARERAEWDEDGEEPRPEYSGKVTVQDLKPLVLAAGVKDYYSSIESARTGFTAEDADALIRDYPRFVSQGLFDALMEWATNGVESDPFASSRLRSTGAP